MQRLHNPRLRGRGCVAHRTPAADSPHGDWSTAVAADSAGVVGARILRASAGDKLSRFRSRNLRPLIEVLAGTLERWEAYGRAVLDVGIGVPSTYTFSEAPNAIGAAGRGFYMAGELTIPADEEARAALGRQWERELARHLGIGAWEPGPAAG